MSSSSSENEDDAIRPLTRISFLTTIFGFCTGDVIEALQLRLIHSSWFEAVHQFTFQMWSNIAREATTNKKSRTSKLFKKICERGERSYILRAAIEVGQLDVNKVVMKGSSWPLLGFAAYHGHADLVKFLIDVGKANIEAELDFGRRSIHVACEYGHVRVVSELLKHGVDLCAKTVKGWTPFSFAVKMMHHDVIQMLIDYNNELVVRVAAKGTTTTANTEVAAASPEQRQQQHRTPFDKDAPLPDSGMNPVSHICGQTRSSFEAFRVLVAAGCRVIAASGVWDNALLLSVQNHHADHVKLLLVEGKVPVTVVDRFRNNILHTIVRGNCIHSAEGRSIVSWLVESCCSSSSSSATGDGDDDGTNKKKSFISQKVFDQLKEQPNNEGLTPLFALVARLHYYSYREEIKPPPVPVVYSQVLSLFLDVVKCRTDFIVAENLPNSIESESYPRSSLLHVAACTRMYPQLVTMLLEKFPSDEDLPKNSRDAEGCTPLERAVRSKCSFVVQALLDGAGNKQARAAIIKHDSLPELRELALHLKCEKIAGLLHQRAKERS